VISARKEIDLLWSELMLSDEEKGDFGAFIDGELRYLLHTPSFADFEMQMNIPRNYFTSMKNMLNSFARRLRAKQHY
jgi:hypothetical protein